MLAQIDSARQGRNGSFSAWKKSHSKNRFGVQITCRPSAKNPEEIHETCWTQLCEQTSWSNKLKRRKETADIDRAKIQWNQQNMSLSFHVFQDVEASRSWSWAALLVCMATEQCGMVMVGNEQIQVQCDLPGAPNFRVDDLWWLNGGRHRSGRWGERKKRRKKRG